MELSAENLALHDRDDQEFESSDGSSDYTYETDLVYHDPQKEWEENLVQLKTLVNFVLLPVIGKVLGRRFANYVWMKIASRIYS
ncbi:hypothetical protein KL951_000635 [Ogataea haglerorum]|nr:hypothetical protein KL951_000635 [Ogataea haglerorum]